MNQYAARTWAFLLALSLLASLAACGGRDATATAMHLTRTEGTVAVSDGGGQDVPVLDNLGLYSGYGVNTRPASYAWINLDDVKLVKLDQNSGIAIEKEGKALSIEVKSGSLFFNVTQPLEEDETMNIRTSTMLVGIRGTCGWVEERSGLSRVYILEGRVECSAGGKTVQVNAGEMGALTEGGELTVEPFTAEDIPAFVRADADPGLIGGLEETPATPAPQGIAWTFNDGTLTISGTGPMADYENHMFVPWFDYQGITETVIIEDGVTRIGNASFNYCTDLTGVTIPESVTSIGNGAFLYCVSLPDVIIPNSVVSIGASAFGNCTSLTGVTIPASVTSIEAWAFYSCFALTDVYYAGSEDQWGQIAIDNSGGGNDPLLSAEIHCNSSGN